MCEAKGCNSAGAEIDHIYGRSPDLSNLQYLSHDCHLKKTKRNLKPITPDHPKYDEYMEKITTLMLRYRARRALVTITKRGRRLGVCINRNAKFCSPKMQSKRTKPRSPFFNCG